MTNIEIHDEQFARWLQERAENQDRSVEDFLKRQTDYPQEKPESVESAESGEGVRRVLRKIYAKARRYWESVGDSAKAALTDEELDEQFQWFDEEGIPRLKSEVTDFEPKPGTGPYLAKMATLADIHTGHSDVASRADEILRDEFADYLIKRMKE